MTVEEYVAALVAKAPPLSERTRDRLALLFEPVRIKPGLNKRSQKPNAA